MHLHESQLLSSALSSAGYFKKSLLQTVCIQIRLLLSDLGPHCLPVCKNRFEKFARIFSRRHKQTTFSDAGFLGALGVNKQEKVGTMITNQLGNLHNSNFR